MVQSHTKRFQPSRQSPRCMHGRLIHWFSITRQYSSTPGAFCFRAKPAMSTFSPLITRSWKRTKIICGRAEYYLNDTQVDCLILSNIAVRFNVANYGGGSRIPRERHPPSCSIPLQCYGTNKTVK